MELKNKNILVIGGNGSQKVREYYKNGENFGVKITYIEQDTPRGIAHAVSLCENFIGNEKFVVFLGDNIITSSIKNFREKFETLDSDALLLLCEVDNPQQFGIAYLENDRITKMIEKPKIPESNLAITGIYFLTPKIFQKIKKLQPSWRNELEIVDALQMILDSKGQINYDIITDFWKDTGTPNDIIRANEIILKNMKHSQIESDSRIEIPNNVTLGKNITINNNSKIIGPAIIGDNCIIKNNSIIGKNVSIGNNSVISNCSIEDSVIMNNCIIDSNIFIKDSIISNNAEIFSKNENSKNKKLLLVKVQK
jgi:glucose-1-phosphate thymidylyltransferase